MKIIKAIIKLNINNVLLTSTFEILLNINNPSHELSGPGNTGIILPIIPIIIIIKDSINKNRSIFCISEFLNKIN